jgi:hypothetical protein
MKKDKHILTTFIILVLTFLVGGHQTCKAQLVDGNYYYGNSKCNIALSVTDVGQKVFAIIETNNGVEEGFGEWFQVNLKGADEGYSGDEGWYDVVMKDRSIEISLDDYSYKIYNYETIRVPKINSIDGVYLHLNHYIEIE